MSQLRHLIRGISQLDVKSRNAETDSGKYGKYIARLRAPISLAESIVTADKLVLWISRYQLGNPAEPWHVGKRLVHADMPATARLAGLNLYKACVQSRPELPAVLRLMFFDDLQTEFSREDFDNQLIALLALTKGARDITGIESLICSGITGWVDYALGNLDPRRQILRRGILLTPNSRHEDLRGVINFLTNLVKFNFPVLEESQLSTMIDRVVLVCKRTGEEPDIRQALMLFDAVIRYGYIPLAALPEVVNVLCSVYRGLATSKAEALSVMQNLLRSHMSQATLKILRTVISGVANVHDDVVLGAVEIMTTRWTHNHSEHANYTFTVDALLEAYLVAMSSQNGHRQDRDRTRLAAGYADSILRIVSIGQIALSLSMDSWTLILKIVSQASSYLERTSTEEREINADSASSESKLRDTVNELLSTLERLCQDKTLLIPMPDLSEMWLTMSAHISQNSSLLLLSHFENELLCFPSDAAWLENITKLGRSFCISRHQAQSMRILVLKHIKEINELVTGTTEEAMLQQIVLELVRDMDFEPDVESSTYIVKLLCSIVESGPSSSRDQALQLLQTSLKPRATTESANSGRLPISTPKVIVSESDHLPALSKDSPSVTGEPLVISTMSSISSTAAIEGLATLFISNFASPVDALPLQVLSVLLDILETPVHDVSTRIRTLVLLSRIRADSKYCMYLDDDQNEPPAASTREQALYTSADRYNGQRSPFFCRNTPQLLDARYMPIQPYLETLTNIIARGDDWSVYSAVLRTLQNQLSNMHLFSECHEQILCLRTVLCELLSGTKTMKISHISEHIKKEDIMIQAVQLLSIIVGYHAWFSKVQEDEIVAALQVVLAKFQKVTPSCIHTLTICAYEIPLSTSRNMSSIIMRLSQLITSTNASVHILTFLSALAKLPDQYVNFREDDYRRVFGIALQHIQFSNATARELPNTGTTDSHVQSIAAYVFTLAFDTLYAWFLAVKLAQRPRYLKWIVDGLLAANAPALDLDAQGQVCYDFLSRFCYSNADIRSAGTIFNKFEDDQSSSKSWLIGNSILTMKTMSLSGLTELTIRRSSGTVTFLCKPNSDLEALSIISFSDARELITNDIIVGETEQKLRHVISGRDTTAYTPSHMLLQIAASPETNTGEPPFLLPDDDFTRRALGTLDRIPVVDFHKIGIIYVGRGQTSQSEILCNTYGSPEYVAFLEDLGELVRLQGNTSIYTGGLDTQTDEDGEFAYAHREKITQVIFHTCTLMPTKLDVDPYCNRKKSHIGNDFVNIIWNNSNRAYNPSTIPSEFNFINIIISPDAYQADRSSQETDDLQSVFYKVRILPHPDLPAISVVTNWQILSAAQLPHFIRTIAIQCSVYAQIHHARGTYTSMWRQRFDRIDTLRSRLQAKSLESKDEANESKGVGYNFTIYN